MPTIDPTLLERFLGKTLLVGVTDVDVDGQVTGREQLFGTIVRIHDAEGIVVETRGLKFKLPPDMRSVSVARPGEYRLKSNGAVVVNPDLLCAWVRTRPAP